MSPIRVTIDPHEPDLMLIRRDGGEVLSVDLDEAQALIHELIHAVASVQRRRAESGCPDAADQSTGEIDESHGSVQTA